jgi:DNA mismatch endonuclease (patch repair protein)
MEFSERTTRKSGSFYAGRDRIADRNHFLTVMSPRRKKEHSEIHVGLTILPSFASRTSCARLANGMADTLSKTQRSTAMAAVRSSDTATELAVRSALHAAGFRFRLHRKDLPGRPDLVLVGFRMAVFVHGCFWHGHRCPRGRRPATDVEFWTAKIGKNISRDRSVRSELRASAYWRTRPPRAT